MQDSVYNAVPTDIRNQSMLTDMATMTTISYAIENIVLAQQLPVTLYVSFQAFSRFLKQEHRYRQLAKVCQHIFVFGVADKELPMLPRTTYVSVPEDAVLVLEWVVFVDSPTFFTGLIAQEAIPDTPHKRAFNAIWTYDAHVVDRLSALFAQLVAQPYRPVTQRDYHAQYQYLLSISRQLLQEQPYVEIDNALQHHRAALLRAGLTHSRTELIVVDPRGRIIAASPATSLLLGEATHDIVGKPLEHVLKGALSAVALTATSAIWTSDPAIRDQRPEFTATKATLGETRRLYGWVVALQERSHTVIDVPQQHQRVVQMVHMLQKPMTELQELISMMPDFQTMDDWQRMLWGHVSRLSSNLTRQVQRLGILYELENTTLQRTEAIDVVALAKEVIAQFHNVAIDRDIHIQTRHTGAIKMHGDRAKLRLAITELLDNAIDNVADGGQIVVQAVQHGANVVLQVMDDGQGVPPSHQTSIFAPFSARGDHTSPKSVHTGLGLALVQAVVRFHNGEVSLHSQEGRYTRVTLKLPAYPRNKQPQNFALRVLNRSRREHSSLRDESATSRNISTTMPQHPLQSGFAHQDSRKHNTFSDKTED
ncbi:MAG: hypothetical protein GFH27_549281n89 [Chloroflexi bacterium AL-W]|nr:hypothetical protein [Chloroflexi bacterium AL-N1]NOK65975.1 hypothetical protein [Chloroflexi bacterium AL-N10]NOK72856.1 hypothetical protein [Chloroflexi bacterium AL-N5]NOK79753.1 hypothetical protein [Chloroflexi bacterium AL-W]NOK88391.1 hypothetical protein [Chloroflexi bacterium AL-N15]